MRQRDNMHSAYNKKVNAWLLCHYNKKRQDATFFQFIFVVDLCCFTLCNTSSHFNVTFSIVTLKRKTQLD